MTPGDTLVAYAASVLACNPAEGGDYQLVSRKSTQAFRANLVDPDALYACPESWRDMITTNGAVLGIWQTVMNIGHVVGGGTPSECGGIARYGACDLQNSDDETSRCGLFKAQTMDAGQPGAAWHAICTFSLGADTEQGEYNSELRFTPLATDSIVLQVPLV